MPNYHQVRALFNYDPLTGLLTWRARSHPKARVYTGMRAGYDQYGGNAGRRRGICIAGKRYAETKVIWLWMTGIWPTNEIDHKDTDPFNNRWNNLREATRSNNAANRHTVRKGLKWAYPREGKFQAMVRCKGILHHVGTFDTEQEAHNAAYLLAQQLHGQFVRQL